MQYLRLLLLPFSLLYALVIWFRNKGYDTGFFASRKFELPVISIGNLAIGGAGKSPMSEYLIRLLRQKYKLAVLSRGYGRSTRGFRKISMDDTSTTAGDEPLQFRKKFRDITVAVSEKRVIGIEKLEHDHDVIILDDAFQHRAVKPGLSLLLFDYTRLQEPFLMLPAGNLRDAFSQRKRADIVVVTKTPGDLNEGNIMEIRKRLNLAPSQHLFFSYLAYADLVPLSTNLGRSMSYPSQISKKSTVFLLTGIANPSPLLKKVKEQALKVIHHDYPDHHPFSRKNITKLADDFNRCDSADKLIVTTEKDAQRLWAPGLKELLENLPVYYLPVTAEFHYPSGEKFNEIIEAYVTANLQHDRIY